MSFSSQVSGWAKDTSKQIVKEHKAIVFELFGSVIEDTPVLQGRLAGNWQFSSEQPATGTLEGFGKYSREVAVRSTESHISKLKEGEDFKVFLTNNLPYAHRIEFDGWSHTKAPKGMVRKNFIRVTRNIEARLKRASSK